MNRFIQRTENQSRLGRWLALGTAALMVTGGLARAATDPGTNAPAAAVTNAARPTASNPPASSRQPAKLDLASFKIVSDRNIFNSYRQPGVVVTEGTRGPAIPQTEKFALTGTMSFFKGTFAFFDGTKSDYKQVLKQDATIAGHKIVEVSTTGVTLEIEGKRIEFKVGMQMSRPPGGDWTMSLRTDSGMGFAITSEMRGGGDNSDFGGGARRSRDTGELGGIRQPRTRNAGGNGFGGGPGSFAPETSSAAATSASIPTTKAEVDDILKKLEQAREQETK